MSLDIIHKNCDQKLSKDRKLPKDSFLVVYKDKDEIKYDITRSVSQVEIFNYYYDNFKNVISISWTDGIVDPKTYTNSKAVSPKKSTERKKRKREDRKDGN